MKKGAIVCDGRFRIIDRLGSGGMSEVYLAEQVSLGRKVAIKILRQDLRGQNSAGERFAREAKVLSAVDHPGVVRVIDFFQSIEATFLILEYAEGENLEEVLNANGPMELARGLRILTQLAEGLSAIHAQGIVHRDFKPHNVILTQLQRGEQARILDFGIAKLTEIPDGLSQPGLIMGTPAYLAPEQAVGDTLDSRTDVYAFALLAFRVLTGGLPFPGPTARDFMLQHVSGTPKRLEEVNPAFRKYPELCNLLARCLDKNPAQRPLNGQSLHRELDKMSGVLGNLSPPPETRETIAPTILARAKEQSTQVVAGFSLRAKTIWDAKLLRSFARMRRFFRRQQHWWLSIAGAVAVALALLSLNALWPDAPTEKAQRLLERGDNAHALQVVEDALESSSSADREPSLWALKVAALYRLNRVAEARTLINAHRHQALYSAEPLFISALCEDFARNNEDPSVRALLAQIPTELSAQRLESLAQASPSWAQWGALRFLDLEQPSSPTLDWVVLYSRALDAKECVMRDDAAERLGTLGDKRAIPALTALSNSTEKPACGQTAAKTALSKLQI